MKKEINKLCRYYEKDLPEIDEHVMVKIESVQEYAITVNLLEYGNQTAMITLAEFSRTKKSKYNSGILLARKNQNKKSVCKVLRVDVNKRQIDLSRKKINQEKAKEVEQKYTNAKKVQQFFLPFCEKFQMDMEEFMKMIVWPLERAGDQAFDVFQQAIFNFDEIIGPLSLRDDIKEYFCEELKKKFTPKKIKLKAYFDMTCYSKRGVEDIKEALRQGLLEEDNLKLEVTLQAAPKYLIICECVQASKGKRLIEKALKKIGDYIMSKDGSFKLTEISDIADDRELALYDYIKKPRRNSQYISEEEDVGMGVAI